ncbi:glycoside hydrolase family 32 protein [Actinotalea sp. Marseille-Q4924]|uniref:glycoside hydrolase family 32 protein n=1 Tax=Actinotalea sp. Marseille-Q4924 TaxID=2866571 RepID=UPI001CE48786|nr:glycoside hydrolase family 32 protein [Actinotalea sp. Marseille-Q4924]
MDDTTRPRLHFTAQSGWINDPLGLTFRDGLYHLFYQYVPGVTEWAPQQRWGHAASTDLLHWTERPVALEPGDGDDGVWSGSIAIGPDGEAALFYTTVDLADVQIGKARLARPTDASWDGWVKKDVVAELPPGVDVVAYRDPYVFHDGTCWRMLMGAGLTDGTATALTYRSEDLESWTYDGLLATRHRDEMEPLWTGAVWECPQVFRLGDRWVLTVSVWEPTEPYYEAYAIGDLVDGRFTAESWGRLSYGPSYYAGAAYADADGTRGLIYWLRGVDDPAGRWASAHSLPHTLRLDGERVIAEPHASVAEARVDSGTVVRDGAANLPLQADLELTLDGPGSRTALEIDDVHLLVAAGEVTVRTADGSWSMPVRGTSLRAVIDGPVLEVFTAGGTMAVPVPSIASVRRLEVQGGGSVEIWNLR